VFKLFTNERYEYNYPIKKYSKFDFIKRRYLDELKHVKDYYHNKDRAVNNSHLLNRLITLLAPSIYKDEYEYLASVTANARFLSKQFDIVSNIHSGSIMSNVFFGKGSREILLYREDDIDLDVIEDNYYDMDSVRVVHSPSTDLNLRVPFNDKEHHMPELYVMTIDIIKLLMQYKYWALDRIKVDSSTNPNVFIATMVLPNIIDSLIDIRIFNRYLDIAVGNSVNEEIVNVHPFPIVDYTKGIDDVLKQVVKDTGNTSIPLEQLLLSIPVIVEDNALEIVKLTHTYFTAQSKWVLYISRIKVILKLLKVFNKRGIARNKDIVNELPFILKTILRRSGGLPDILPKELLTGFFTDVKAIQKITGKR